MSSKVRYILALGGYYKGADVTRLLSRAGAANRPKTPEEYQLAAKSAGGRIWMFREPRNVSYKRSRYKQLCARIGIGRNLKKPKKISYADLLLGATQHGTNPVTGHAPEPHDGIYHFYTQATLDNIGQQANVQFQHAANGGNGHGPLG